MIGGGYLDFSNFLFPNDNVSHYYMHGKNSFDYFVENIAHFVGVEVSEIDVPFLFWLIRRTFERHCQKKNGGVWNPITTTTTPRSTTTN